MKLLNSFDSIGEQYEISISRKPRRQTPCGAILSIIACSVIIYACLIFFWKLFDTTELDVSSVVQFTKEYPKLNMLDSFFYPIAAIATYELTETNIPTENLVTFQGYVEQLLYDEKTGLQQLTEVLRVPYRKCSEVSNEYKTRLLEGQPEIADFVENFGYCPEISDPSKFFVAGSIVKQPYVTFTLHIYPCSLEDQTKCIEEDYINYLGAFLVTPQINFDPKNAETPLSVLPEIHYTIPMNSILTSQITVISSNNAI